MCIDTPEQQLFEVNAARLEWGEYKGDRLIGEGDIYASYSADRICEGKPIRQPFPWQGNLWVCIGITGRGLTTTKQEEFKAYKLTPLRLFVGESRSYAAMTTSEEGNDSARNNPLGSYHGMLVKHRSEQLVMFGPPATFIAEERTVRAASAIQLGLF
jgi:hypothetical protein